MFNKLKYPALNAKLKGIFNYCADGIVILNEDGIIEQVNPACETMIGHILKMNN